MSEFDLKLEMRAVERCALCGAGVRTTPRQLEGLGWGAAKLVKCGECGLVYLDPAPTPDALAHFYSEVYFTRDFRDYEQNPIKNPRDEIIITFQANEEKMDEIEGFRKPPGKMLDIGCSYGGFLLEAAMRGWKTHGLEPFDEAAQFCRESLGLNVTKGDIYTEEYPPETFDILTMWDVIEHVFDPVGALRRAAEIAKPNAFLFLTSPNADSPAALVTRGGWVGWKLPAHLQFFNHYTMSKILLDTGWKPLKVKRGGNYPGQILGIARRTR